jgi:hypothetical protein
MLLLIITAAVALSFGFLIGAVWAAHWSLAARDDQ